MDTQYQAPQQASDQINGLFQKVMFVLTKPKEAFLKFKSDGEAGSKVFKSYALPLIVIAAIIGFVFQTLFFSIGFSLFKVSFMYGLFYSLLSTIFISLALQIGMVYFSSFILNALAPSFGTPKNSDMAFKTVMYSLTPSFIGLMLSHIPFLGILISLAGACYSIYLLYLALPVMMETPADKVVVYMIVFYVLLMIAYFIGAAILGLIIAALVGAFFVVPGLRL